MIVDVNKLKVVDAAPPELDRGQGPGLRSPLTLKIAALEPGQAFGLPIEEGQDFKVVQRNTNTRIKGVNKLHGGRQYVTRTLKPGTKLGKIVVTQLTLGVYRIK